LKKILCTILMNIPRKWVKAVISARKCWSKLTPSRWSFSRRHRLPKPCIFQVSKWLDLYQLILNRGAIPSGGLPHVTTRELLPQPRLPPPQIHLPGQQMPYAWLRSTGHFGADLGLQRCHRHHQATPMFRTDPSERIAANAVCVARICCTPFNRSRTSALFTIPSSKMAANALCCP